MVYSKPRSKHPILWPVFIIWIDNTYKQERERRDKGEVGGEEGEEEKRRGEGRQPRQGKASNLLFCCSG